MPACFCYNKAMGLEYTILKPENRDFPESLKQIDSPPQLLYARGDISLLKSNCMAFVGSRRCTKYGRDAAALLVKDCVRNGYTVVSGLAAGIDAAAHEAALSAGGKTIAVMGGGFNKIYPAENLNLYERICEKGLVITEYAPEILPALFTFPMRNRIISGLSEGVVVVEAGEKSGALITAYKAIDQGKEVFAVPGNIFAESHRGANNLLLRGHAYPVASGEDIFRRLNKNYIADEERTPLQLDIEQERVFNILSAEGELHIEVLQNKTGMKLSGLNSILFNMELLGVIVKLPGNYYKVN